MSQNLNTQRRLAALFSALLLGTLGSCAKTEEGTKNEPNPAPMDIDATPLPSAADLPVAEDFELEAAQLITSANYQRELEALAQEIEADSPR